LERLNAVPLADEAAGLLLAACEGDSSLAAKLGGDAPEEALPSENSRDATAPTGAFLSSITVAGFRGVGPPATLNLEPGPGLTVVAGRNGSGKSSFAEGLEVLFTGDLKRWEDLSAIWREGWRNLHVPDPARISAELLVEGAGAATVERAWPPGAGFGASEAGVQAAGEKRAGLERLGWRDALVTYRPFLSHSELEAFLSGPSHLYDLLSSVLGLEDLVAAEKRLSAARKDLEGRLTGVSRDLPALLDRLAGADDERAAACRLALTGTRPDTERALAIATGGPGVAAAGDVDRLRLLSLLAVPSIDEISGVVTALRHAAEEVAIAASSEAGQSLALAGLLDSALAHYHVHGAGDCPVCGRTGALDEDWRTRTEAAVALLREQAAAAQKAQLEADAAKARARELLLPVPAVLIGPTVGAADPQPARAAWDEWAKRPDEGGTDGLRKLADHLEHAFPALYGTVADLVSATARELQSREDRWAPVAADVAAWCARAKAAEAGARPVRSLKVAVSWLKNATDDIRNARLAPLGDQARSIWAMLRQESNVDLGAIRLSGSGTRRQLDLQVNVDGAPGAALGIMSQGEINALALSIFLPRATIAASPFRFLVIDDPVQAMDPAKVDGLSRVLDEVSQSRQVLVLTHDDRLPEAISRLDIAARILEVTRRPGSVVEVRPALNPVERQLKDAEALSAEDALPEAVAARLIPGMCRLAVEAAFTDAIRRQQLRAGRRHAQVEADIESADKLNKKAALAMFGDASQGGRVLPRLDSWDHSAANTYRAVNRGAHNPHRGALRGLITQTRKLIETIRGKLP
jgi:recombinational DNA repair ATPase RecF